MACLRHEQGVAEAAAGATRQLRLCAAHLRAGTIRLALVGGLPGTGKSTVAGGLADRVGAVLLSSDRIRKELAGIDPTTSAAADFGAGLYRTACTDAVYRELLRRAEALLSRGESVILDASWTAQRQRDAAADLARRAHTELVELECRTSTATAAERIRSRTDTPSDATAEIAEKIAAAADPWPTATPLSTSGSVSESVSAALAIWGDPVAAPRP